VDAHAARRLDGLRRRRRAASPLNRRVAKENGGREAAVFACALAARDTV
jgi:hypothetical protein